MTSMRDDKYPPLAKESSLSKIDADLRVLAERVATKEDVTALNRRFDRLEQYLIPPAKVPAEND